MTIGRSARIVLSAIVALVCTCGTAAAQTNDEVFPNLQWNFSTPGARANAMGRAFIGMADDATATISNPAGLISLTKPQVYIEYKNTNLKVDRLSALNSLNSGTPTTFSKDINALSFLTISMPFKDRFAVGLTRHQFLDYQEKFTLEPRPIPNSPGAFVLFPVDGNADFKGVTWGLTLSAALTPMFNVGLTVSLNQFDAQADATRNAIQFAANGAPSDSHIIVNKTTIDQNKTAASFSGGILFKPSEKLSIGVNVVQGPKFSVPENILDNPGVAAANSCTPPASSCGTNQALVQGGVPSGFATYPRTVHINVPNRFGAGVAFRPESRWLFALDVVRINYSSLSKDFTLMFDDLLFVDATNSTKQCLAATPSCTPKPFLTGAEYTIASVTEVHAGAEYNIVNGNNPIFIRGGFFTNPDHRVKYNGFSSSTLPPLDVTEINASENATYNKLERKSEKRGTIGAGIALGRQMQFDVAYVFGREFIASTAVRFR